VHSETSFESNLPWINKEPIFFLYPVPDKVCFLHGLLVYEIELLVKDKTNGKELSFGRNYPGRSSSFPWSYLLSPQTCFNQRAVFKILLYIKV
jgi:hypothetical protein